MIKFCRNVQFSLDPDTCGKGEILESPPTSTEDNGVYFLCIELIANGFLRHMVRRIIVTIRPIAEGSYDPKHVLEVLHGELPPGPSVPSKGLWLHNVWLTEPDW